MGGNACKQPDNSFSNAYVNGPLAPITLTQNSAAVTGTGFQSNWCNIVSSGTLTATNGSAIVTDYGENFTNPNPSSFSRRLIIHGTKNGGATTYVTAFSFTYNSPTSITMNGLWPGDSGSFTYVIDGTSIPTMIAANANDNGNLSTVWACTYNSPTSLTLDRPWTEPSGPYVLSSTLNVGGYTAVGGYGQQPYMLGGMGVFSLNMASKAETLGTGANPTNATNWLSLARAAAAVTWTSPSYDPYSHGLSYGFGFGGCDQRIPINSGNIFQPYIYGGPNDYCQSDASPGGISYARNLAVEAINSLSVYYASNPTPALRGFGDSVYGSSFANSQYTKAGYYDPGDNIGASNCNTATVASYKWPGFCFGMGTSHQWPAARLGGVLPAVNRAVDVGVCLGSCSGSVPGATSVAVVATAPNGLVATTNCTTSPCMITADARQGSYIIMLNYLGSGGEILARSEPHVITVQ